MEIVRDATETNAASSGAIDADAGIVDVDEAAESAPDSDDDGALGRPNVGDKRKRGSGPAWSDSTTLDPKVIDGWTSLVAGTTFSLKSTVFGWHDGATPAQTAVAHSHLKGGKGIYCVFCHKQRKSAHKGQQAKHVASRNCTRARLGSTVARFNGALLSLITPPAVNPGVKTTADVVAKAEWEDDTTALLETLSASCIALGLGYQTVETMLRAHSTLLRSIHALGHTGIGSDNSVRRQVAGAISHIEDNTIRPALRHAITNGLPIAVIPDESSARVDGGVSTCLLFFWYAGLPKPMCLHASVGRKTPNSDEVSSLWMLSSMQFHTCIELFCSVVLFSPSYFPSLSSTILR